MRRGLLEIFDDIVTLVEAIVEILLFYNTVALCPPLIIDASVVARIFISLTPFYCHREYLFWIDSF